MVPEILGCFGNFIQASYFQCYLSTALQCGSRCKEEADQTRPEEQVSSWGGWRGGLECLRLYCGRFEKHGYFSNFGERRDNFIIIW